jgi:hypothetical protein
VRLDWSKNRASGFARSVRRQGHLDDRPAEDYSPEQFFADAGVLLAIILTLALVVHFAFMMRGS